MIRNTIFSLALLLCAGVAQISAQVNFHTGATTTLYKEAKASDKLIFIDIYATWCPPCKAMERDVFSREDIGNFMSKHFVSAKYNIDEEVGRELANAYNVRSIPTYLIFDADGDIVASFAGAMSPEEFTDKMSTIVKKVK